MFGGFRVLGALALVAGAMLAGVAQADTRVKLTGHIEGIKLSFDGTPGLVMVASLRDMGGRLGVCGLSFAETASSHVLSRRRELLGLVVVELRRRALPVATNDFPFYPSLKEAEAGTARCLAVNRPWEPAYATERFTLRTRSNSISE
ncbi:MAG: hypothetical protein KF887_16080 [Paracoccaceae bacterium]|nr:MAG: hypothetical protein KF887_16080 [Paracoccaceae bacterium]